MANNSATSLCPAYGNKVTEEWSSVWVPLLFIILRTTQFSKTWIKILIHTLCCFLEASVWLFMTQHGRWLATFKLNANALEIGQLHFHKSPGCFRYDWDWKRSLLTGGEEHTRCFSLSDSLSRAAEVTLKTTNKPVMVGRLVRLHPRRTNEDIEAAFASQRDCGSFDFEQGHGK